MILDPDRRAGMRNDAGSRQRAATDIGNPVDRRHLLSSVAREQSNFACGSRGAGRRDTGSEQIIDTVAKIDRCNEPAIDDLYPRIRELKTVLLSLIHI